MQKRLPYPIALTLIMLGSISLLFGPPPPGPGGPGSPKPPTPGPGPATPPPPVVLNNSDDSDDSKVRLAGKESFRGKWKRTDGDYTLDVGEIDNNTAKVKYFNPNPINVESARFVKKNGKWELTIVLRDEGYDGSKYQLYYNSDGPVLEGRYKLGSTGESYDIVFKRLKKKE